MEEKHTPRISTTTKYTMLFIAALIDIVEFTITASAYTASLISAGAFSFIIGIAGLLTTVVSWGIFIPWFWMKGVTFSKGKKFRRSFGLWATIDFALSWAGVDGILPEFTWQVYRNIKAVEKEDQAAAKEATQKEQEKKQEKQQMRAALIASRNKQMTQTQ